MTENTVEKSYEETIAEICNTEEYKHILSEASSFYRKRYTGKKSEEEINRLIRGFEILLARRINDRNWDIKIHPSPPYLTYKDLEVGKIYTIMTGYTHSAFKIHDKITYGDRKWSSYTVSYVKTINHTSSDTIPHNLYTQVLFIDEQQQQFTRFKEGTWHDEDIVFAAETTEKYLFSNPEVYAIYQKFLDDHFLLFLT